MNVEQVGMPFRPATLLPTAPQPELGIYGDLRWGFRESFASVSVSRACHEIAAFEFAAIEVAWFLKTD